VEWTLVKVDGANVPAVAPPPGSTGILEFAYTSVPVSHAAFFVTIRYPAGGESTRVTPAVILRSDGRLVTLHPEPVSFTRAVPDRNRPADK
jgi:hypothetical protein